MGITRLDDYRRAAPDDGERRAVARIITESLHDYADRVARVQLSAERVIAGRDDPGVAAAIVGGWIATCAMQARDAAASARERAVFAYLADVKAGEPLHTLATEQVRRHLALLAAEWALGAIVARVAPPG